MHTGWVTRAGGQTNSSGPLRLWPGRRATREGPLAEVTELSPTQAVFFQLDQPNSLAPAVSWLSKTFSSLCLSHWAKKIHSVYLASFPDKSHKVLTRREVKEKKGIIWLVGYLAPTYTRYHHSCWGCGGELKRWRAYSLAVSGGQ